jgi:hypothetical protein
MPRTAKLYEDSRGPLPGPPQRGADPRAVVKLLDESMHGDEAEQRETFESLRQALDENRPAGYKLFS